MYQYKNQTLYSCIMLFMLRSTFFSAFSGEYPVNIAVQCWLSLVYAIPEKKRSLRVLLGQFLATACCKGQLDKNIQYRLKVFTH